jgi:hypothetical protein
MAMGPEQGSSVMAMGPEQGSSVQETQANPRSHTNTEIYQKTQDDMNMQLLNAINGLQCSLASRKDSTILNASGYIANV